MRKIIKKITAVLGAATIFLMGYVTYLDYDIPDSFYVYNDERINIYEHSAVSVTEDMENIQVRATDDAALKETATIKVFGVIPVKTAYLHKTSEKYLVPCGTPFGIKMLTAGVVVVGLTPIETEKGTVAPAKNGGLKEGDIIISVNGEKISSFTELSKRISASDGREVKLLVRRKGKELNLYVSPVKSITDGVFRCGIWARDSSAGIGTVTFYDAVNGRFGGLGHPICDVDTGEMLPLSSGEVVPVTILDVEKGVAGDPGELKGTFISNITVGNLSENTETGVYGQLKNKPIENEPLPVCLKQDVKTGSAEILSTVSGRTPKNYKIEIEKINLSSSSPTKNMVVRIVDPALLEITGGIVQGMSGSPIIQNGKLVGAVTHVFVNDPTRGYGIFVENMLE